MARPRWLPRPAPCSPSVAGIAVCYEQPRPRAVLISVGGAVIAKASGSAPAGESPAGCAQEVIRRERGLSVPLYRRMQLFIPKASRTPHPRRPPNPGKSDGGKTSPDFCQLSGGFRLHHAGPQAGRMGRGDLGPPVTPNSPSPVAGCRVGMRHWPRFRLSGCLTVLISVS